MKLYSINIKDYSYDNYSSFVVVGESINNMLENLYTQLFPDKEDIPYYLRSSNFDITYLGEFIPDKPLKEKIIARSYYNA